MDRKEVVFEPEVLYDGPDTWKHPDPSTDLCQFGRGLVDIEADVWRIFLEGQSKDGPPIPPPLGKNKNCEHSNRLFRCRLT